MCVSLQILECEFYLLELMVSELKKKKEITETALV